MSGPEVDATILMLLRGPSPCPICGSELPEWCEHRKRARFAVQGDSGPECGDCGSTIDLRMHHACTAADPIAGCRELTQLTEELGGYANEDAERLGRETEARAITRWLRHLATGRGVSATKAHTYRDLAERIERREQDS